MRSAVMSLFVNQAKVTNHPVTKLVVKSIEAGFVVASKLEKELIDAGYRVEYEKGKAGIWVEVYDAPSTKTSTKPPKAGDLPMIAQGYSSDKADALLQAIAGYTRELQGK